MDFNHSQDRQLLANALERYLQQNYSTETRRTIAGSGEGWSPDKWRELCELGVIAALVDEAHGGLGGTGFDIAAVFEQLGKGLVVEPLLGTLAAVHALSKGNPQADLMAAVVSGDKVVAWAYEEPQSRYDLTDVEARAEKGPDGWRLSGKKAVVSQLKAADYAVVSARISGPAGNENGIGLFLVHLSAQGVRIQDFAVIDGGRAGDLTMADTPAKLVVEDGLPIAEEAVAAAIVALSWEAIGVMDRLLNETIGYLQTRKQFGVPLATFQALRHRVATMALEIEQARSSAINAAASLGNPRRERERMVSAAKFTIGRVGTVIAEEAIQMHGGIGMTRELSVSHYAKRLMMIDHQFGDEDYHLERFIRLSSPY